MNSIIRALRALAARATACTSDCNNGLIWNAGTGSQINCPTCRPGWGSR